MGIYKTFGFGGFEIVKKEGELKRGTIIHQTSLVIDNLLNIERRKNE